MSGLFLRRGNGPYGTWSNIFGKALRVRAMTPPSKRKSPNSKRLVALFRTANVKNSEEISYKPGQIIGANFPFSDLPEEKNRPILVWKDTGDRLVVSMITSRIRYGKWEVAISPDSGNGLSKPSVIRIDKTISIEKSRITTNATWKIGEANPFVLIVAKEKLAEWLESHA